MVGWPGRRHHLPMEFRILGPLEVVEGGRSLPLGGPLQRAVLAMLLVHANTVVSTDRLIDALWGDRAPGSAARTLQVYVSRLRKTLGGDAVLVTRPPGYLIEIDPEDLDAHRFVRLLGEARAAADEGAREEAASTLGAALALWRGPALADFA